MARLFQVTVVGTRVLQGVRAVDADQPGPYSTVQYAVLPGAHSVNFMNIYTAKFFFLIICYPASVNLMPITFLI